MSQSISSPAGHAADPIPLAGLTTWRLLRWLPFAGAALMSLVMSALAPDGRKAFQINWSLSLDALHFSITKGPHVGATMLLGLLAVVATGPKRLPLAFLLTVLVGAGWELGQTTVVGHNARLADLAPDALGAAIGCAWGALVCWLAEQSRRDALPARRRA
jgi:VanZ family protein